MINRDSEDSFISQPQSGIVRSRVDEIEAIQTLLDDVYKDTGDGRTLFRELLQNADDAEARRLSLTVFENGWHDSQNSLLCGRALVVANDGKFTEKDHRALPKAVGGSKKDEVNKIGTFGVGLKSVFHICEAFLYIGAANAVWRSGVLNPWAGTGDDGNNDPIHPDWDSEQTWPHWMRSVAQQLLGHTHDCFLLWIPLRQGPHLDRGEKGEKYGLRNYIPKLDDVHSWINCEISAALLLAQCGNLQTIDAGSANSPDHLSDRRTIMQVSRKVTGTGWVGRYLDDSSAFTEKFFRGSMLTKTVNWSVAGVESLGSERLRQLRGHLDWPKSSVWNNNHHSTIPRKAIAHATVTVLRPVDPNRKMSGTRLRWAVFLPLDDNPKPITGSIVDCDGRVPAWEIILHGYFWPSQDRRSIPGVTDSTDENHPNNDSDDMRNRWNRMLCEEVLLPLLPSALAWAAVDVEQTEASKMLESVVKSNFFENRLTKITQRNWLLPIVAAEGVKFETRRPTEQIVLSIPQWSQAPDNFQKEFFSRCTNDAKNVVFIDYDSPSLKGKSNDWTDQWLEQLLNCISTEEFGLPGTLKWIKELVTHVLDPETCNKDQLTKVIAQWIARKIGEGALNPTVRRTIPPEKREVLRIAWRELCVALSEDGVVYVPVECLRAAVELAVDNQIGYGLLPIPIGEQKNRSTDFLNLDQNRLISALFCLGRKLKVGNKSEEIKHSRLLLADEFLTNLKIDPCRKFIEFSELPLIRATRLPVDKEEAWSINDLHYQVKCHHVFASPAPEILHDGGENETQFEKFTNPKIATTELANALSQPIWFVNGRVIAFSTIEIPQTTPMEFSISVLRANDLAEPTLRMKLLDRLTPNIGLDASIRSAVRRLLTGCTADFAKSEIEIFDVRDSIEYELRILLRLLNRSYTVVEKELKRLISQDDYKTLSVCQDDEALDHILAICLDGNGPVDWTTATDKEAIQLLKYFHSSEPGKIKRWCKIPLHRDANGNRVDFNNDDQRTYLVEKEINCPQNLLESISLLDPEPGIFNLYYFIPPLSQDAILRLMLESSKPWKYSEDILACVRPNSQISLPTDSSLRELLRHQPWLPDCEDKGLAPNSILIVPKKVLNAVTELANFDAFGDKRLPDAVDPQVWKRAETVVRDILGSMSRNRQLQRMVDSLNTDQIAKVDDGKWLVMPDPWLVDQSIVERSLNTILPSVHPGWRFVHTVKQNLQFKEDTSQDENLVLNLVEKLCAPIPPERQVETLNFLAKTKPKKDSDSGIVFRKFLECFVESEEFFDGVLPKINLPTQDGHWHSSKEIARSEIGVARRHILISEVRSILNIEVGLPIKPGASPKINYQVNSLEKYFEAWRGKIRPAAVGLFLSSLVSGKDNGIAELVKKWLSENNSIEAVRKELIGTNEIDPCAEVYILVVTEKICDNRVIAINILGETVEMDVDESDNSTLFTTAPVLYDRPAWNSPLIPPGARFWEIKLREINPKNLSSSELQMLLGNTVEKWTAEFLNLNRENVIRWWSKWTESSQADLGPVLASIKAHLPLTLRQLNVEDNEEIYDALKKAEKAQREREQLSYSESTDMKEREALDCLNDLIKKPENAKFLWRRVNELMHNHGYRPDSVLLELSQNADDALAQAAQINNGNIHPNSRRILIKVHDKTDHCTVDFFHWGRLINDTGGSAFPAGREHQWDQDLYCMMIMNLSNKQGEVPAEASSSSTTGRFGLGFKSVNLVSSSPSVVSGFIAFSIIGGLLPEEQKDPDDADSLEGGDNPATRIRLPLRRDVKKDELIQSMFSRFSYARVLLPVFAREVREVIVEGGLYPGIHTYRGAPVEGAPGWSVGDEMMLPDHDGQWRIFRFRPADAGKKEMGTIALVVGLKNGMPTAFNSDFPFVWNVVPTSESWGCGYVINGPFKLDPGRSHISLNDKATLQTIRILGDYLGKGLIQLQDALSDTSDASQHPVFRCNSQEFLSSLWKVLVSGRNNSDELRKAFLDQLHGGNRGVSAWMTVRSVIPTDLPAPFPKILPPLRTVDSWDVAEGIDEDHLCAAFVKVVDKDRDFQKLVSNRCIVSREVEQLLLPFFEDFVPDHLRVPDLLTKLFEQWNYQLTPERLHALRPLVQESVWDIVRNALRGKSWKRRLEARTREGYLKPLSSLLLKDAENENRFEYFDNIEDELLRSAFAPDEHLLDSTYIEGANDWRIYQWLRGAHKIGVSEITEWMFELSEDLQPAAIRYLLHGNLRDDILQELVDMDVPPHWLTDYEKVFQLVNQQTEDYWRRQSVLAALFPSRFPPPKNGMPVGSTEFFKNLDKWWNDDETRGKVVSEYEERTWPNWLRQEDLATSLRMESEDHWLALLILGACQSIGRVKDGHHCQFLEWAHSQEWWTVFKNPDDKNAWMDELRNWQDDALDELRYRRWMELFPTIHQLSRFWKVYARLLKTAENRQPFRITTILKPRIDETLTGAGVQFDAPPDPFGIGIHWILRELVRLEIIDGKHLYPDCWVPSEQVLNLLNQYGLDRDQIEDRSNSEKAHVIFDFMSEKLETEASNLHRMFDLPLRHVALHPKLQESFE